LAPDLSSWQFLAYRCFGVACVFAIISRWRDAAPLHRQLVDLGWSGAIVTLAMSVAASGFIIAMKLTAVANALFLASCSPLLSAVLGYFVLGERLNRGQIGAVALGMAGLAVIVGGGIEAGDPFGDLCALASALGFAISSVVIRRARGRDFTPAMFGYGVVSCLFAVSACVVSGSTLAPSPLQAASAFAAGFVLMGLGFGLFLRGAPHVPVVGQMVLSQTETVFGPLWVWLAFGERPANSTLAGGAIIFVAVLAMAVTGVRQGEPNLTN
jgi:DME family drug/metabolite transporter